MADVQRAFRSMLGGDPPVFPENAPLLSFEESRVRAAACHAALKEFAAGLDAEALARTARIPFFPDPPCVVTVGEGLVQVAMHTHHHRGQCMTRLRDFGGTPRNVDWIIWLWKQKPPARWG